MSKFDSAVEKFDRALDRVHTAVEESGPGGDKSDSEAVTNLRSENARVMREMGALREGAQALDVLTGEIETRLESTIRDLRNLMENER